MIDRRAEFQVHFFASVFADPDYPVANYVVARAALSGFSWTSRPDNRSSMLGGG